MPHTHPGAALQDGQAQNDDDGTRGDKRTKIKVKLNNVRAAHQDCTSMGTDFMRHSRRSLYHGTHASFQQQSDWPNRTKVINFSTHSFLIWSHVGLFCSKNVSRFGFSSLTFYRPNRRMHVTCELFRSDTARWTRQQSSPALHLSPQNCAPRFGFLDAYKGNFNSSCFGFFFFFWPTRIRSASLSLGGGSVVIIGIVFVTEELRRPVCAMFIVNIGRKLKVRFQCFLLPYVLSDL